jgi:hypothetical protein
MKNFKLTRLQARYAYVGQFSLENLLPGLRGVSIGSNLSSIDFSGVTTLLLPAGTTLGGSSLTALGTITSSSAQALAVGLNGLTNPAFNVDSSTGSQAAGLNVKGATAAGNVAISVISSGAAANLLIDALGTGTISIGSVSTGIVTMGTNLTFADAKNIAFNATTGTKIGTATTQKLAFYNSTPIVQPATPVLDVTGFVAGSGTASKSDSSWAGPTGATAYGVGDIVRALKALGLLAA